MKYYKFDDYTTQINKFVNIKGLPNHHHPIKKRGYKTKAFNRKCLKFKYNKHNSKLYKRGL